MHLAVLAWGDRPYAPGVKVTVDLAEALVGLGTRVSVVLVESNAATLEEVRGRVGKDRVRTCDDLLRLPHLVKELGADLVYAKDHIASLEALGEVKRQTGAKTLAFTSGFHGLEALRPRPLTSNSPRQGGPGMRRFLPFARLTKRYRELLEDLTGVVAISYYSEMLLELLYGVRPVGVVYPVVDPRVFSPPPHGAERKGVLAFLGPAGNRDPREYLPTLEGLPADAGPIHLFGAPDATGLAFDTLGKERATRHVDLRTEELARLYAGVRWTYATTEWEGFGYVGPESLLCGTPVLAEVAQPWMEVAEESAVVRVSRSKKERIALLAHPARDAEAALARTQDRLRAVLSPSAVGRRFLEVTQGL